MARKKKEIVESKDFDITKYDQHMREQDTGDMIDINYMPYAMSVIISRALPDVRDGMKPSQRKVLYTMKIMNLTPGHKSKSANIAGTTLRFNPHSDQSCYETMVRLTDNNETLLSPYVAGKGSFGKHYSRDMKFAASRYCVVGDTLVSTDNGLIKIKNIIKNSQNAKDYDINIKVKSFDGKNQNAIKLFNSGLHDTYRILLENGMEISCTPNHPLLTINNGRVEWKLAEDIITGDICLVDIDSRNTLYGNNSNLEESTIIANDIINEKYNEVPDCVLSGNKEYISNFYNILFDNKKTFKSKNKVLIKQLQILFMQSLSLFSIIVDKEDEYELVILFDDTTKMNNELVRYVGVPVKLKEHNGKNIVYSLKVNSECHSFTANGFINHNTEASLSALGMELFKGINKDAIDMIDNYDGTMKEPTVLPVSFPAILANPTLGIAVGFASNICSFNMKELCEATIERIRHPKSNLLETMPGPDFSTGGLILYDKQAMLDIYNTGKGSIKIRSKYEIDKKHNRIEIKEIPYSTTAEAIVESVISLCKSGKIKEINDIRDDTDKNGLTITIEYKRTCDPEQLMLKLFKTTPLEDVFSCNFNVIVDGNPRCLGVYSILDEWIKFRKQCVVRMLTFDRNDLLHKLHLLRGLEKILLNIDKAIKIIKGTEKDENVVPNLIKSFKIDEEQATYIADMKLRNINKEYILSRTAVINDVESQIAVLNKQIDSDAEIKKIVISDLQNIIKKFGIDRKSEIIDSNSVATISDEVEVQNYDLKLYITEHGYIKKINSKSINDETEIKIKEDDEIKYRFDDDNSSDLLIFTDKTNVYKLKVCDIPECKPSEFGAFLKTIANIDESENIVFVICTKDYSGNVLIAFENGKVAKYPINTYETKTNRKMLKNGFFGDSKALFFDTIFDDTKYYMFTDTKNRHLVFTDKDIPLKSTKTTQGIQIIRLSKEVLLKECKAIENKKSIQKFIPNNYPSVGKSGK